MKGAATLDRSQALADGVDAISIDATLTRDGKPVAGAAVTLLATGHDNHLTSGTTDAAGTARLTLRSTVAEEKTLSVSFAENGTTTNLPSIATVRFVAGPAASLRFDGQPASTTAGVPFAHPVSASIYDANGNRILDASSAITLALDGHAGGLSGATEAVDAAGEHTFGGLAVTFAGSGLRLQATVQGLPAVVSDPFDVVASAPDAAHSALELDHPSVVADGRDRIVGTVHVTDAYGNPIAGVEASVVSDVPADVLDPGTGSTGPDGRMRWSTSTRAMGDHVFTASAAGFTLHATVRAMPRFALGLPPLADVFPLETVSSEDLDSTSISIASGDLDGDGAPDFVMSAPGFDHLGVAFNQGDGTFFSPSALGAQLTTVAVGIGDADGDGRPDVINVGAAGEITVFRNEGARQFGPGLLMGTGLTLTGLPAFTDFDGDGRVDVLIPTSTGVAKLQADGSGSFVSAGVLSTPAAASSVILGDVNEDGFEDWIVTTADDKSNVFLSDGAGGFSAGASYPQRGTEALADVTGDGHLDLVVLLAQGVALFPGDGAGSFDTSSAPVPCAQTPIAMTLADLNGDDHPEVVVTALEESTCIFAGGAATLGAPLHTWTLQGRAMAVGDFDQDGQSDVLMAKLYGAQLARGDGLGGLVVPAATIAPAHSWNLLFPDLNGDGVKDRIVRTSDGTLTLWLGNGDGTFQSPTTLSPPIPLVSVRALDADGDGKIDLVARSSSQDDGDLYLLKGNGDGSFQALQTIPQAVYPNAYAVADLDQNGRPDFISAGYQAIGVSFANGDGTYRSQTFPLPRRAPDSVCVADFDGDGYLDVATADKVMQAIDVMKGEPGGALSGPVQTLAMTTAYGGPTTALICPDLDHDGSAELIYGQDTRTIHVFGRGSDGLLVEKQTLTGAGQMPMDAADFDLDGNLDLLVSTWDGVAVWLGNGKGQLRPYGEFSAPLYGPVVVDPIDGVAGADLAQVDWNGSQVTMLNHPY